MQGSENHRRVDPIDLWPPLKHIVIHQAVVESCTAQRPLILNRTSLVDSKLCDNKDLENRTQAGAHPEMWATCRSLRATRRPCLAAVANRPLISHTAAQRGIISLSPHVRCVWVGWVCDVCGVEWVCDCVWYVVCGVCMFMWAVLCGVLGEDYVQCVRWKSWSGKGVCMLASGFSRD